MTLQFKPKQNRYANYNNNVTFDTTTQTAISYRWWIFTRKVNNTLVFNSHYYSHTTAKHQADIRGLLRKLDISYLELDCGPSSNCNLFEAINTIDQKIDQLKTLINTPKTHKQKNDERKAAIKKLMPLKKIVQKLERSEK